jgi:uncharacterized protein (TIGR02118 family)
MYKVAALARFPEGVTNEDGRRYWAETHGALGRKVPLLARYVQSHVAGPLPTVSGASAEETSFDGYACCWFADRATFEEALESPEWRDLVADGPNAFDMDWLAEMSGAVEERTIKDGPAAQYKVVCVARFKPSLTKKEASAYWTETHGGLALEAPGISRYVQNHVVEPIGGGGWSDPGEVGFDGFSECWFEDEATFLHTVGTPEWAALVEDGGNVFDMDHLLGAVVEDRVIKG